MSTSRSELGGSREGPSVRRLPLMPMGCLTCNQPFLFCWDINYQVHGDGGGMDRLSGSPQKAAALGRAKL